MNLTPFRALLSLGALCACLASAHAQVIELRATINAQQEVSSTGGVGSTSPAVGNAIMLYDVRGNTFDLIVSINGMANAATASHIHEAAAGANGSVVTNLGGESAYTRNGTTLTATFRNIAHGGDKLRLLEGGAYFNIHSAQFPGGEVRGQLVARPVRLVANLDTAQEQAAFPSVNLAGVANFGGAVAIFDPVAKRISLRTSLFNFTNPFTNSHIHTGAPGVSGPVSTQLGNNANAGAYSNVDGFISGAHDIPYAGDTVALLTGGTYLNYHSQTFAGGQLRGQLLVSNETASTRIANLAVRGFVGTGDQVLIQGLSINGTEPVRLMITAKGPSLSAFGITGALANPVLALHDSAGRQIALNDNIGTVAAGSELSRFPGVPTNANESALVVVLPPGNYTAIVSAAAGTGIALLEVADLRTLAPTITTVSSVPSPSPARASGFASLAQGAIELCAAVPLAVTASR
jgi:hypothetical protein